MGAFLVIDVFDKITDAVSRLGNSIIVVEVNFFLFESPDESFSISVLSRTPPTRHRNLNPMMPERREVGI